MTLAVVSTQACQDPTQVTLVLRSADLTCENLKGVEIVVAGSRERAEGNVSGSFITTSSINCTPGAKDLGTLVVTPGETGDSMAVIVIAGVNELASSCRAANGYKGCIVARRALSFIEHTRLTVTIDLEVLCVDVPCDVVSTCRKGTCISSDQVCNEDEGTCIAKDDVPGANPDGSINPDAPNDSSNNNDTANNNDTGGPSPFDGSNNDGNTNITDGQSTGKDGTTSTELCRTTCPGAPISPCTGGNGCCRVSAHNSTQCIFDNQCSQGAGSRPPGVFVCCKSGLDCDGGQICCLTYTNDAPADPVGQTACVPAVQCAAPNQFRLCEAGDPCDASRPNCMSDLRDAYFTRCF